MGAKCPGTLKQSNGGCLTLLARPDSVPASQPGGRLAGREQGAAPSRAGLQEMNFSEQYWGRARGHGGAGRGQGPPRDRWLASET